MMKIKMEVNMNSIRFYFFAFNFLLLAIVLSAQDTWVRTYAPWGNSQFDTYFVDDVVVCQDGGYALNGTHVWYDGSNFDMNPYMIKTDSEGNIEWAERDTFLPFISCSHTLLELEDGSFITSGYETPPSSSYLLKRDAAGDTLWSIPYQGFTIESMQETDDGNLILGGSNDYPAIRKITPEGETIWTQDFLMGPEGTTGDHSGSVYSITQTLDNGSAVIGSVIGMEVWYYDFFLLKISSYGDSLWSISIPEILGWGGNRAFCINKDLEDNLIYNYAKEPQNLSVISKYSSLGDSLWTVEFDNDEFIYSLLESEDNNYILYGQTIIKMTSDKDIIWERELPGNFGGDSGRDFSDGERSIKLIDDGYICVRIIDGIIGLVKMNSEGFVVAAEENIIPKSKYELHCFPNPFNPSTTISYSIPAATKVELSIYNVKGQKVNTLVFKHQETGEYTAQWDGIDANCKPVTSGVYLFSLKSDNQVVSTKALLLK